jgi:hypothetical protein
LSELFYQTLFGSNELLNLEIDKKFEGNDVLDLVSVAAYKKDFDLIKKVYETITDKDENFLLLDELIFYLAYFKEGIELLEEIYQITENSKLRFEIISSITEINREKGVDYIREYITSDDLSKLSIAIYLIDRFNVVELKKELIELMNKPMLEDLKYQALFTLGKLKYDKILPLLLKGAVNKNDQQLLYIESIKNYDDEKVKSILIKEAKKLFQDKIIKLKLAQIIYQYDKDISDNIFSKFIKSNKLDIQGFTIELIANLKNDKFINEVNDIFKSNQSFNKANSIMYFRMVNYSSKLKELQEFYFSETANKNMKDEILEFISVIDKKDESLKSFYQKISDEEKRTLLKNIIDNSLKQRNI